MAMRETITVQEAEEKARVERSEAWLALMGMLLDDAEAEALEALTAEAA